MGTLIATLAVVGGVDLVVIAYSCRAIAEEDVGFVFTTHEASLARGEAVAAKRA